MNRESIRKFHGKKVDTSKVNFCLRIIGRLICCESVNEAIVLYKLGIVVMTNKKITTDIEKFVQKLAKTINFFYILLEMEKNAGCFATDEDDHKMIIEAASLWKQL